MDDRDFQFVHFVEDNLRLKSSGPVLLARWCGGTCAKAVFESPRQGLEVFATARAGGLPALGLETPVVTTDLRAGIAALCTGLLLAMQGSFAAAMAQPVSLLMALTHARSPIASACQPQYQVKGGFLLNIIVRQSAAIFKLFPCEDQALLVRRDALLVLDLCLNIINRVRSFYIKSDGLPSECLHEDLHGVEDASLQSQ